MDIAKHLNQSGLLLLENSRDKSDLVKLMLIKLKTKDLLPDLEFKVSQQSKSSIMEQRVTVKLIHTMELDKLKT